MIFVTNSHPSLRFPKKETFRALECVLKLEAVRRFELSVVFVGNRYIRRVNKKFLQHDYTTDVISFPLGEDGSSPLEGELYINLDRARSQAKTYGVTFAEETRRLLIHGALHLLGYKDSTPRTKAVMTRREDEILARLSVTRR
ncbi:MAG TPA: rRNA maturation RNase YbeY [Bacteroidetes bacterium]|nr:MAG: rRNA maturation RNase YbeY [Ignavibacteria bacterium GWA2_54_16]HCA81054.1 rRNA maturation RNase YbeY [Bacteroidota bacterium]